MAASNFQFDPGPSIEPYDLKIQLLPFVLSGQKKEALPAEKKKSYTSFVQTNRNEMCKELTKVLNAQVIQFTDAVSIKARITDVQHLNCVQTLIDKDQQKVCQDIIEFMQKLKCHENLNVKGEELYFSVLVDEESYQIGLKELEAAPTDNAKSSDGSSVDPVSDAEKARPVEDEILLSNNINKTIGEETSVKADVKKETHDSEIPKEGQNQDDDMNLENGSDESTSGSESKFDKTSPVSKKSELKKQNKRQKKEEKQKEKHRHKEAAKSKNDPEAKSLGTSQKRSKEEAEIKDSLDNRSPGTSQRTKEVAKSKDGPDTKPPRPGQQRTKEAAENKDGPDTKSSGPGQQRTKEAVKSNYGPDTKPLGPGQQRTKEAAKSKDGRDTKPPGPGQEMKLDIFLVIPKHIAASNAWINIRVYERNQCKDTWTYELQHKKQHKSVWAGRCTLPLKDGISYACYFGVRKKTYKYVPAYTSDAEEKFDTPLSLTNTFCHIFTDPSITSDDNKMDDTYEGSAEIAELVWRRTSMSTLKESLMMLHDYNAVKWLVDLYTFNRERKFGVMRHFQDLLQKSTDVQILLLLHILGSLRRRYTFNLDLPKDVAVKCLNVVCESHCNMFPSHTDFFALGGLCRDLYDKAFKKRMTTFESVYYCYPFLTSDSLIEILKSEKDKNEDGLDRCLAKLIKCFQSYDSKVMELFLLVVKRASSFDKVLKTVKTVELDLGIPKEICREIQSCVEEGIIFSVEAQLKSLPISQMRSLQNIAQIIQKLRNHGTDNLLQKLQLPIEEKVISIVKFGSSSWSDSDIELLSDAISSGITYSTGNQRELLKVFAETSYPKLSSQFLPFLEKQCTSLQTVEHQLCLEWLKQEKDFIKNSGKKPGEKLLDCYCLLGRIVDMKCIATAPEFVNLLEECVYSEVDKVKVEVVMKASENMKHLTPRARELFDKHCNKRLMIHQENISWDKDHDMILEDIFGPGPLQLHERAAYYIKFLRELLSKHPASAANIQDIRGIGNIFCNSKFWMRVMTCGGPSSDQVKCHHTVDHVKKLLSDLFQKMQYQKMCPNYAKDFLDIMDTNGEENCAALLNIAVSNFENHNYGNYAKNLRQSLCVLKQNLESLKGTNELLQHIDQNKCKLSTLEERESQLEQFTCDVWNSKKDIIDIIDGPDWEKTWKISCCLELHKVSSMQSFKTYIMNNFDLHDPEKRCSAKRKDFNELTDESSISVCVEKNDDTDWEDKTAAEVDKIFDTEKECVSESSSLNEMPGESGRSISDIKIGEHVDEMKGEDGSDESDYASESSSSDQISLESSLSVGDIKTGFPFYERKAEDRSVEVHTTEAMECLYFKILPDYKKKARTLLTGKNSVLVCDIENFFEGCSILKEVQEIEKLLNETLSEKCLTILGYTDMLKSNIEKAEFLERLPKVFMLDVDETQALPRATNNMLGMKQMDLLTTETLYEHTKLFLERTKQVEKEYQWNILTGLARSQGLVEFLISVKDEDLRNLIDAVEEHSDELLQEGAVSDLIQLKNVLKPVLHDCSVKKITTLPMLLESLNACFNSEKAQAPSRINNCAANCNSLKALYLNVANRGEVTKQTVERIVKEGVVVFHLEENIVTASVKCTTSKKSVYSFSQMSDLRSRALLICNTEKVESNDASKAGNLVCFVELVDLTYDILLILEQLNSSGHFEFDKYHYVVEEKWIEDKISHLYRWKERVQDSLHEWERSLDLQRSQHYYLNYLHGKQLPIVFNFFKSKGSASTEAFGILRYMKLSANDIDCTLIEPFAEDDETDVDRKLWYLGKQLTQTVGRLPDDEKILIDGKQSIDCRVEPGNMYIAHVETGNPNVLPVILSLYRTTTGCFPLPSHVLFCDEETTMEECNILLKRSLYDKAKNLYCIVGTEMLKNDVLLSLMDHCKELHNRSNGDITENSQFLLALICRSPAHHTLLNSFADKVHKTPGLSTKELETCLQKACSTVYMITSELPGLGKTENIHDTAAEVNKGVVTIPINGLQTKKSLLKRLQKTPVKQDAVLHFDVGFLENPQVLDHLIFEVVVMKFAICETYSFELQTSHVAIEICNTLNNYLQNDLYIVSCFRNVHLKWNNFDDFVVSREPHSAVQTVGQYFGLKKEDGFGERDITISDSVTPMDAKLCQSMLQWLFKDDKDLSFSVVNIFLEVLADQLRKLTVSQYFRIPALVAMLGDLNKARSVRQLIVTQLKTMSKEFSCRSIATCKEAQNKSLSGLTSAITSAVDEMVGRVEGMIQWSSSNHLLLLFHHQDSSTVSALYRDVSIVPANVKQFFEYQMKRPLSDLSKSTQEDLQKRLERLVCEKKNSNIRERLGQLCDTYALTPDNLLKMVLVILRIRSGIPVVLMGETGCGKTTLVKYLAMTCNANFHVFQFHAGVTCDMIEQTVIQCNNLARENLSEQHWLFLDEINTCNHLGILNEIISSHSLKGDKLSPNLVTVAACNPYRLRMQHEIFSCGFKEKAKTDEFSNLVYRVHPLPETMIDFVWDYGTLHQKDELLYIKRMVKTLEKALPKVADIFMYSQDFIRKPEMSVSAVSLRDVHRCRNLVEWFVKFLETKDKDCYKLEGKPMPDNYNTMPKHKRALILALSLSYVVRITTTHMRNNYWKGIAELLSTNSEIIIEYVRWEQVNVLNRMILPHGTAKNTALRENVFVILICMLNRIPIFLVGKPGCSKSLSVQVLKSSLRGPDSEDKFLKTLPELYIVSYQGSESSTSEGIQKVFEKANNYRKQKRSENILPVVLLDEVGLAEISRFNPLKVLHSLLEPQTGKFPDVAVVGISNWALDPAKMNRAIHLSRPDLTADELFDTGKAIREGFSDSLVPDDLLKDLAVTYFSYQETQPMKNFHGLRDFYSLVKFLCARYSKSIAEQEANVKTNVTMTGIYRNFGGLSNNPNAFAKTFKKKPAEFDHVSNVGKLIEENLGDHDSRHLMLITSGDSSVGLISGILKSSGRQYEIIYGSNFEEDMNEEYNYRIISKIILCMEQGVVLVLKDLEGIYSSLYDMLNQNYTIVGRKKNCRIALDAYSNPMCVVHDNFKCIVIVDKSKVDYSDPPFLNRFEKQVLHYEEALSSSQMSVVKILEDWVEDISNIKGKSFCADDAFYGFQKESIPSLIHRVQGPDVHEKKTIHKCKELLLYTCPPSAVLRMSASCLAQKSADNIEAIQTEYFDFHINEGIQCFLHAEKVCTATVPKKYVLMTNSGINTDVGSLCQSIPCQVEKLSAVKSEKQLSMEIASFFREDKVLFVLQCKPSLDSVHMRLAKLLLENQQHNYIQGRKADRPVKHVAFVVHLSSLEGQQYDEWKFDYANDWEMFTLDRLEETDFPIKSGLLGKTPSDLLQSNFCPIKEVMKQNLVWALGNLEYPHFGGSAKRLWETADQIRKSENLLNFFTTEIMKYVERQSSKTRSNIFHPDNWYIDVVKSPVKMHQGCSLHDSLRFHLEHLVKSCLVILVWFLEDLSALWTYINIDVKSVPWLKRRWEEMFQEKFSQYQSLKQESTEPNRFLVSQSPMNYCLPFARDLLSELDDVVDLFLSTEHVADIDSLEDICPEDRASVIRKYRFLIEDRIGHHLGQIECDEESTESIDRLTHDFCMKNACGISINNEEDFYDESLGHICRMFLEGNCLSLLGRERSNNIVILILTYALSENKVKQLFRLLSGCGNLIRSDVIKALESVPSSDEEECISLDEYIVGSLCRSLLPSTVNLKKFSNVKMWFIKCSQVLAFASKVSHFAALLHFLRLCRDIFVVFLSDELKHCVTYLEGACKKMLSVESSEQEAIECDSVFQHFVPSTKTGELSEGRSQLVSCMYFIRCLDSNPDTCRKVDAINYLSEQTNLNQLLQYAGPIVQRIIVRLGERDILSEILQTDEVMSDAMELQAYLECIPVKKFYQFICLLSDVIENVMSDVLQSDFDTSENSLQKYQHAVSFIQSAENWSVKYVVCVAYVRLFIGSMTKLPLDDPETVDRNKTMLQRVSAALTWKDLDGECLNPLKVFLLKKLYTGTLRGLEDTIKLFPSVGQTLAEIPWPSNALECGIGFNGICLPEERCGFDKEDISGVLAKLQPDCTNTEAVVADLLERLYWPKYIKIPGPAERAKLKAIALKDLPSCAKVLLKCVLGQEDFIHSCLNITQESTYEELLQASILLHIFTLCASNSSCKNILQRLSMEHSVAERFMCDVKELCVTCLETETEMIICKCNHVTFRRRIDEPNCNACNSKVTVQEGRQKDNLSFHSNTRTFHVSGILLFGCLLAKRHTQHIKDTDSLNKEHDKFRHHWNSLTIAMNVSKRQVTYFLHMFLQSKELKRATDIAEFVQCCNAAFENCEHTLPDFTKRLLKGTGKEPTLISILNEADTDDANGYSIIARERGIPTVEKMCQQIVSSRFEVCPFLHTVMMHKDELFLLKHILPIVMWHLMLHQCVNGKMSQKDVEQCQINDFLYLEVYQKERRKSSFEKFRESWLAVRSSKIISERIGEHCTLPEVNLMSPLSVCVVKDKQSPMYKVMSVLCGIQNKFIEKSAVTALMGCKGLSFLQRQSVVEVPMIQLHAARESQVITFALPEAPAEYCQNGLGYGKGIWEKYNLEQIEKDMADKLMLGKHYLILGDEFPFTMYRNEIFHQGGHSLVVLRQKTTQEELTESTKNTLHEGLTENNGQLSLKPFMNFLETVMIYLKKTDIQEADILNEYAHKWGIEYKNVKSKTLRDQIQKHIRLCHVCSLYEFLEEEAAKTIYVDSLDAKYNVPPSEEVRALSEDYTHNIAEPSLLLSAIRRLVVRHISSGMANVVSPDSTMDKTLFHPDLWPKYGNSETVESYRENFPAVLMMESVKWFHDLVKTKVKQNEETVEKSAVPLRLRNKPRRKRVLVSKT